MEKGLWGKVLSYKFVGCSGGVFTIALLCRVVGSAGGVSTITIL